MFIWKLRHVVVRVGCQRSIFLNLTVIIASAFLTLIYVSEKLLVNIFLLFFVVYIVYSDTKPLLVNSKLHAGLAQRIMVHVIFTMAH